MKTKLTIAGMTCGHCVKAVEDALKGLPGVKKVKVNLKKGAGEVDHDDSVVLDAMKAAVAEAGFTAS
ncbi:MAG: cation transporter [Spirochaetaceae bacterium]|jgi:copper chaperone|nr:cation transporter [Spirochaetaceae bacterium]